MTDIFKTLGEMFTPENNSIPKIFQHEGRINPEYKINVLKNAIDALELLMKNGVEEHLENEFSTVRIEDWIEELKAVYNCEPSDEPTSAQFERDGGFGLSAAERNK